MTAVSSYSGAQQHGLWEESHGKPINVSDKVGATMRIGAYTSGSVAENSGSAWQGAKISASADILAPTELHLVHNSINTILG